MMDIVYEFQKYRGVFIPNNIPTIRLFHHHQKLVFESRQDHGLDPYPNKNMGNLSKLVEALSQLIKAIMKRR